MAKDPIYDGLITIITPHSKAMSLLPLQKHKHLGQSTGLESSPHPDHPAPGDLLHRFAAACLWLWLRTGIGSHHTRAGVANVHWHLDALGRC